MSRYVCLLYLTIPQALFDAIASFGGFYVGRLAADSDGFPFRCAAVGFAACSSR